MNPIYLHFLDRELLSALKLYDSLPIERVLLDLKMVLLTSFEWTYCSLSLVFENRFARSALIEFREAFYAGHIKLAIKEPSIYDFINTKQQQYEHAKEVYPFYYDNSWEVILRYNPELLARKYDTTNIVADNVEESIISGDLVKFLPSALAIEYNKKNQELSFVGPKLLESLYLRENSAVTKLLFTKTFEEIQSRLNRYGKSLSRSLEFAISEAYVTSYLDEYCGTLATGLTSTRDFFSHLSTTKPLYNALIWKYMLNNIGLLPSFLNLNSKNIVLLRSEPVFINFVNTVRRWWKRIIQDSPRNSWEVQTVLKRLNDSGLKPKIRDSKLDFDNIIRYLDEITNDINEIIEGGSIKSRGVFMHNSENRIFVVHGREDKIRKELFKLLRSVGLNPREFNSVVKEAGGTSQYVGTIIDNAMKNANAIVILFTPDELSKLRPELCESDADNDEGYLPRPNVLFEAGLAIGQYPERTLIVSVGNIRHISDLAGRHILYLDSTNKKKMALFERLKAIGCKVDYSGEDWHEEGDFSIDYSS